jgi:Domain of unknown function (DUF4345)
LPAPERDPIAYDMRRFQQIFLALFGGIVVAISLLHVALGPAKLLGLPALDPTMDSEDRFYATQFLAFGVVVLSCVRDVEQKGQTVRWLALAFFVGGLARLASMAAVGPPNTFFLLMTALELSVPAVMVLVQRRVSALGVRVDNRMVTNQ